MRDHHITTILEQKAVGSLSDTEAAAIEAHARDCPDCLRAYEAARVSAALIRARAAEATEVSPFFKARVMAALRERGLSAEATALERMWRSAGALISALAAVVVILVGLTIFTNAADSQTQATEIASGQNIYSPEYVVIDRGEPGEDGLVYDQVLSTMYDSEDGDEQ